MHAIKIYFAARAGFIRQQSPHQCGRDAATAHVAASDNGIDDLVMPGQWHIPTGQGASLDHAGNSINITIGDYGPYDRAFFKPIAAPAITDCRGPPS